MKKHIILVLLCILVIAGIASIAMFLLRDPAADTASVPELNALQEDVSAVERKNYSDGEEYLNIYTLDKELGLIVEKYAKLHPEFKYRIVGYENAEDFLHHLNYDLQDGFRETVDIYCVPASYSKWYIKGEYSRYACTYEELGIDVEAALKKADIPQKVIDAGTNPDGELIALPYKANINLFMYRRSIAMDVWGTDDPAMIADILGAGTGKWDKFMEAAQTLKEYKYFMLPDIKQLSGLVETDIFVNMISGGVSDMDPKWQEFMDVSKKLSDIGCIKDMEPWTSEWIKALDRRSGDQVFGLFTEDRHIGALSSRLKKTTGDWVVCLPPVSVDTGFYTEYEDMDLYTGILVNKESANKDAIRQLVEWITLDCSETGLQYCLANGTFYSKDEGDTYSKYGGKRTVISGTILKNSNNNIEFLDEQNISTVLFDALQAPSGKHHAIGISLFTDLFHETQSYLREEKDKETAIADFKKASESTLSSVRGKCTKVGFSTAKLGKMNYLIDIRNFDINTYDYELADLFRQYINTHPIDHCMVYGGSPAYDNSYALFGYIMENMQSDSDEVDIYNVPAEFSYEMIKGESSRHACTYKELGIDVDTALRDAGIPQNLIDTGKNPEGEVVALPYMANVFVFAYRRSIAMDVWGTDDPNAVADIIGSGTEKWGRFLDAAKTLKEHGYYIMPDYKNTYHLYMYANYTDSPKPDNSYNVTPELEEYMNVTKHIYDNGYAKDISPWTGEWFKDLNGEGDKPVFGFFENYDTLYYLLSEGATLGSTAGDWAICVPPVKSSFILNTGIMVNKDSPYKKKLRPFIEWLTLDCSKTGGQYFISDGGKRAVISKTILKNSECSIDYLGGQNTFPVLYEASQNINYDLDGTDDFSAWYIQVEAYVKGEKDKETAINDFKNMKVEKDSEKSKYLKQAGLSFLIP